uniref:Uncharacterized protein n=1 Tax=Grammatophora oceanica TaxID=210454 RepID=A0A6U5PIM1_9STRA|mmetsp:Transcript_53021/g.79214  ORF Transcript_53021/g.79214 Transcript_53021/m.79214 type:complete len:275 (+) Transcript_53021:85-909(+)
MKTFFLCLLSASTAAAHLLRTNHQRARELIVESSSEDAVISKSYLTDDYSTQYSTYSHNGTYPSYADTIAVFDVCTSIEAWDGTYFRSTHLTDFCYLLGPNLGSLCFEDTDCGDYSCGVTASAAASDIAKQRVSVSKAKRWGNFPIPFEDRTSTVTYDNVFHCYDPANPNGSDRTGGGGPQKSIPCTSACADCALPQHSCRYDADCVGTSECVRNQPNNLSFCAIGKNILEEGTCCSGSGPTSYCADGLFCSKWTQGSFINGELAYECTRPDPQ